MPTATRPLAYAARRFTQAVEQRMDARYAVTRNTADTVLDSAALIAAAKGRDYLFCSLTEKVTAEVIAALAPTLKVICTLSVGVEHVDLEAARRAGIKVLNTPDVLSEATAEIAILLMLGAARRAAEGERMVRADAWTGWTPTQLLGQQLTGRRLGILGLGRIGKEVARRAAPFGLKIHYHSRRPVPPSEAMGATYHETSDGLLGVSEIFCICAPSTPELKGFLDARRIDLLPANAIVVNVARGDMVDDGALIEALQSRRLFAAGLDVYRGEPNMDPRYRTLDNLFSLPHLGSATVETRDAMGFVLLDGLEALERGETPHNQLV
jgi:lactate dehydrogenase-like 2-hydroxyacid dehydrogenase